jgi:hypothetical protein
MNYLMKILILYAFSLLFFINISKGQQQINSNSDSICLYIPLTSNKEIEVNKITNKVLCFSYDDKYGRNPQLPVRILDWKQKEVAHLTLDKKYGLNEYSVGLEGLVSNLEIGQMYHLIARNDVGRSYKINFMLIDPPDQWDPVPDIIPNGVEVFCESSQQSTVEYYGKISGGRAPYEVTWYVFKNASGESLLYKPKKLIIEKEGDVPFISVESALDYYVLLNVIDACGSERDKVVHIVCDEQEEGKFNMLFEPIDLENLKGKRSKELSGVN